MRKGSGFVDVGPVTNLISAGAATARKPFSSSSLTVAWIRMAQAAKGGSAPIVMVKTAIPRISIVIAIAIVAFRVARGLDD